MKYSNPIFKVIITQSQDVITTSADDEIINGNNNNTVKPGDYDTPIIKI